MENVRRPTALHAPQESRKVCFPRLVPITYLFWSGVCIYVSTCVAEYIVFGRFSEMSKIKNDYNAIVECANDAEGLTGHQLRRLEEAKSGGPKKILSCVEKLRQTAYELMQHDYGLFRKKLLKDLKIVKK